jgi:hypothetical protein
VDRLAISERSYQSNHILTEIEVAVEIDCLDVGYQCVSPDRSSILTAKLSTNFAILVNDPESFWHCNGLTPVSPSAGGGLAGGRRSPCRNRANHDLAPKIFKPRWTQFRVSDGVLN